MMKKTDHIVTNLPSILAFKTEFERRMKIDNIFDERIFCLWVKVPFGLWNV